MHEKAHALGSRLGDRPRAPRAREASCPSCRRSSPRGRNPRGCRGPAARRSPDQHGPNSQRPARRLRTMKYVTLPSRTARNTPNANAPSGPELVPDPPSEEIAPPDTTSSATKIANAPRKDPRTDGNRVSSICGSEAIGLRAHAPPARVAIVGAAIRIATIATADANPRYIDKSSGAYGRADQARHPVAANVADQKRNEEARQAGQPAEQ